MSAEAITYYPDHEIAENHLGSTALFLVKTPYASAGGAHDAPAPPRVKPSPAVAFAPLTAHNYPLMYAAMREPIERYIRYMFAISPEDAEDLAADAFVKALRALPGERAVDAPTTWMYGIAKHTAIDFVRRRNLIPIHSLTAPIEPEGGSLADQLVAPEDDESHAATLDRRSLLAYIFSNLRPKQATALRLYDHEGYSYQEIMDIMHVGYSNAKNLVSRGREQARLLAAEFLSGHITTKRRVRLAVD